MDVHNIANNPLDFVLSGKKYKVKRLSILDLKGSFVKEIKEEYFDDVINMANRIKDAKERYDFQNQALKNMPKNADLDKLITEKMNSIDGGIKILFIALNKCQEVTVEEVNEIMLSGKNTSTINALVDFVLGNDVGDVGDVGEASESEDETLKNQDKAEKVDLEKKV